MNNIDDDTPPLSTLIAILNGDGPPEFEGGYPQRDEAAMLLAKTEAGWDALVAATRHADDHARSAAAHALRGCNRPDVVAALLHLLRTEQAPLTLETVCMSLAAIGASAAPAIETLETMLAQSPSRVTAAAAYALGGIGPPAVSAIPALLQVLRRSVSEPQRPLDVTYAVLALRKIEAIDPDLPSLLVTLLSEGENTLSFESPAIELIGLQGPSAAAAEPLLRRYMEGSDKGMGCIAAGSLARISPSAEAEALGFLIERLGPGSDDARWTAVEQLAALGALAAPAIPALRGFQGDEQDVEEAAAAAQTIQASLERTGDRR